MRQNSKLRELANIAKQRLRNGNYNEVVTLPANSFSSAVKASTYFMCNARALKKEYIKAEIVPIERSNQDFENRVISMLQSQDIIFDVLGKLTDNSVFNGMDELARQQYMLKLSDEFLRIKQQYLSSQIA